MTDNSKIEINPSVLQNRSQTYQSLTDVNGADVFTDDYEEKVKDYQQKEQRSYEDTKEQVFIKKMDENAGKEEAVKEQLFLATATAAAAGSIPYSSLRIIGCVLDSGMRNSAGSGNSAVAAISEEKTGKVEEKCCSHLQL